MEHLENSVWILVNSEYIIQHKLYVEIRKKRNVIWMLKWKYNLDAALKKTSFAKFTWAVLTVLSFNF